MFPSKVIFSKTIDLESGVAGKLIEECFDEVYSPKQTLEELLAELEARVQTKINKNPSDNLYLDSINGLIPDTLILKIEEKDTLNLAGILDSKGKKISLRAETTFKEVILLGHVDDHYMICSSDADIFNDFTDVISINKNAGLIIKKVKMIE